MGAGATPISHLLHNTLPKSKSKINPNFVSPESPNPNTKTIIKSSKTHIQRRHLLFFSLPTCITVINSAGCCWHSALAAAIFDPVTDAEREASVEVSRRVAEAVKLLERGKELQALGDYDQALQYFNQVIKSYKDFELSDYARVGRAIALYEVGDKDEAIAEMEDVSISLKGYPEVHAALAAALYSDKHASVLAENQFTIATLLDPHYTDLSYVRETKHWPPSLIRSLKDFITLS